VCRWVPGSPVGGSQRASEGLGGPGLPSPTPHLLGKPFGLTTPGGQPVPLLGEPAAVARRVSVPAMARGFAFQIGWHLLTDINSLSPRVFLLGDLAFPGVSQQCTRRPVKGATRSSGRPAAPWTGSGQPAATAGSLVGSRAGCCRGGRCIWPPHQQRVDAPGVARYAEAMRECTGCGQALPRTLPGPGRLAEYCSAACKQRAYRKRGGRASGTTGAQRRRRAAS
jgi:hypothetical protein